MTATHRNCYIQGISAISPQWTCTSGPFLEDIISSDDNILTAIAPQFSDYISPLQLRRLSRMLRIGLAAAVISLRDAGVAVPDAVITATGYGFQEDTGKFLREILEQGEAQVTPTFFMHSTYNALAGLIAQVVKCRGYNTTHAGRGFSFETAVDDAIMLLEEKEAGTVLVGSFDEASALQHAEYVQLGYFKQEKVPSRQIYESGTIGTIQGEGSAFFLLSATPLPTSLCHLQAIRMIYRPATEVVLVRALDDFLQQNGLSPSDIDVCITGLSGDAVRDAWNLALQRSHFHHAIEVRFKHLTGEYATASSFALWLAAMIYRHDSIPAAVRIDDCALPHRAENVLICNHFLARNFSFILLTRVAPS